MRNQIIAVANGKGGVGKSTVSVHLAGWLHDQGHRVLLADCDAQQSSSQWLEEANPDIDTVQFEKADDILDSLQEHAREFDYVVADGPGSNSETSRALLMVADLAVLPCKASLLEVRALAEATKILMQARKIRGGPPPATIILNMVQPRFKLAAEMKKAASALRLPIVSKPWILRQVYADAPGQGKFVWKMGAAGRIGAAEVQKIFEELMPEAIATNRQSSRSKKEAAS
ncbi:MinD/ParA/CobQ/CobA-like protein [Posidoniimonas corsicana]|uniref:MinD/ParA/CobQ/CobA-like protein n=1 Tax=Posidoniimonas corsicana TaxID=1938618 RepID=A0A5C5VB32_9BACT|nr:ParA family protein [Posidoniimonas corsicana]TWT35183.1 MinD/ParA/CobQ/CobA-like protein [Posidoniimonas corsicana]